VRRSIAVRQMQGMDEGVDVDVDKRRKRQRPAALFSGVRSSPHSFNYITNLRC
jgi:hypothetical protein